MRTPRVTFWNLIPFWDRTPLWTRLLPLVALLLCTGLVRAETIRLRNGAFLVGNIESPDENGFVFERYADGGRLRLRWEDLIARDAERLRASFQLVGEGGGDLVTFRAFRVLRKRSGGSPIELIGELVNNQGGKLTLRVKGNPIEIPLSSVTGTPQYIDVPIRDVLTADEIYRRKLTEIEPGEDADKHVLLADYLLRVEEFERAKEHLAKAKELGGGSQPNVITGMLERVDNLLAHKAEADLLREIRFASNRNQFGKAQELIDEFAQKYPRTKLAAEFELRKEHFAKARRRFFVKEITKDWYDIARDESKAISRDRDLGVEEARVMAAEQMGQKIRERIAKRRGLEVPEVEKFFGERFEFPSVPQVQIATYGHGSWLLGERDLVEGTARGKLAQNDQPQQNEQAEKMRRELERRLREFQRRNQSRQGAGQEPEQKLDTPDEWWKSARSNERQLFVLATYAERSGDMKVLHAMLRDCEMCGTKGTISVETSEVGRNADVTCPTCHGLKYVRVIRFQ